MAKLGLIQFCVCVYLGFLLFLQGMHNMNVVSWAHNHSQACLPCWFSVWASLGKAWVLGWV